jgi:hypothetical protein
MSYTISGSITVTDSENNTIIINANELQFEIIEAEDTDNGLDRTHQGSYEDEDIELTIEVLLYEKPEGIKNDVTVNVTNGTFVSERLSISID